MAVLINIWNIAKSKSSFCQKFLTTLKTLLYFFAATINTNEYKSTEKKLRNNFKKYKQIK